MVLLNQLFELWREVWSFLGPLFFVLFMLLFIYLKHPEKFERVALHVTWALSVMSDRMEKRAISREVMYITGSKFRECFPFIEKTPSIDVMWGEEERAVLDVKHGKLILVLKRGKSNRSDNIAKALTMAIPYLLTSEMESVYDRNVLVLISAHIARNLVKDKPSIVEAVNEVIRPLVEKDPETLELAGMLVDVDDRSLFTRILVPEMVEVARERYPQRDPRIDQEVARLIRTLSVLARAEESEAIENPFCGNYFRMVFVLVAKPEKIRKMLMPHVNFTKRSLEKCADMRSIYILAAGKANIAASKALLELLKSELMDLRYRITSIQEHEYRGRYKSSPSMPLYVCRIKLAGRL